jgi:hypothetical protein
MTHSEFHTRLKVSLLAKLMESFKLGDTLVSLEGFEYLFFMCVEWVKFSKITHKRYNLHYNSIDLLNTTISNYQIGR